MTIRCPTCKQLIAVLLPQYYRDVTVTVTCPTCFRVYSVDVHIAEAKTVGPSETK